MMKKAIFTVLTFSILLALAACAPQQDQTSEEGRTVFTVTDAAADMGSVNSVEVTIDQLRVHSQAEGWTSVNVDSKTFDLLQLKAENSKALLAEANLSSGNYDQMRLAISRVRVTDAEGESEARLPSNELRIMGDLNVNTNSTSTATFDFIADESLHVTGQGNYIMAPVIQVETRENARADVRSDNRVDIGGGNVNTNVKVGMDENGTVGVNVNIPAQANLSIDAGKVRVASQGRTSAEGRTVFTVTDAAADMESVSRVDVTIDEVSVHSEAEGWMTVSTDSKTFDLLQLKAENSKALLAEANLSSGNYDQMRLAISRVRVTDAEGESEARLPSNELKIMGDLNVNANSTSTATFDFIADESLHVTGQGNYIMAPVIQLETRENSQADVRSNNRVDIRGGNVNTNVKVGMDENGTVGVNVNIPAQANLSIDSGKVKVTSQGNVDVGIGGSGSGQEGSESAESNTSIEAEGEVGVNTG